MKHRKISIEVAPLSQLFSLSKADFPNLKQFHRYKKQQIDQYRNQLLSVYFQKNISDTDIQRTEYGKPFLVDDPGLVFNHSHSQQNYAIAMSTHIQDLGIDLEDLDRQVRFEALAKHAFHPNEWQRWQQLDCDPEYWFKVWTTKEAVLKAVGLGIRISLNTLDTQVHPLHHGGRCSHPEIGIFAYQNYHVGTAMLTVAWRSEDSCKGFAFPDIQLQQR